MYNEYQPSLLLAPYIDKYWEFKGNPDYGMKINILPDGCTDFIFTLGEVADIAEQESLIMQPYRSYFVGPMSRYSTLITYAKSIHMFGIRFLPCGLFRFMQLPLEELGNQRISTFESGGIFNDSLAERLCEQPYIQDKIRLIESFLTQALCTNNKIEKQISYAVDCINLSKGQLPIRSLVENVCLCQRHFERKFIDLYKEALLINRVNPDRVLDAQREISNAITTAIITNEPTSELELLKSDIENLKSHISQ